MPLVVSLEEKQNNLTDNIDKRHIKVVLLYDELS